MAMVTAISAHPEAPVVRAITSKPAYQESTVIHGIAVASVNLVAMAMAIVTNVRPIPAVAMARSPKSVPKLTLDTSGLVQLAWTAVTMVTATTVFPINAAVTAIKLRSVSPHPPATIGAAQIVPMAVTTAIATVVFPVRANVPAKTQSNVN